MQTIIPYLAYEDAPAALTFLRDAFGFEERFRMAMEDGRIGHAEVTLGGSVSSSSRRSGRKPAT